MNRKDRALLCAKLAFARAESIAAEFRGSQGGYSSAPIEHVRCEHWVGKMQKIQPGADLASWRVQS